MSTSTGYGKIATSGSLFAFDIGDVVNSYKGEPSTNLSFNNGQTDSQYLASTITWVNAGSWTQNTNETDVAKPVILGFNTADYRITSGLNTTAGGSIHYGCGFTTVNPSTTYTVSVWYRQNKANISQPYLRTNVTNVSLGNLAFNGDTNSANWPVNRWIRISASGTTASNENGIYISNYIGTSVGDKIWYFGHQVEAKSYATALVAGTRSVTQGLLPLIGSQSLDLSNVSFNSSSLITFDGINDYISTGDGFDSSAGSLFADTGINWSVSCIFKFPISPTTTRSTGNTAWVMLGRSGGIGGAETFSLFVGGNGNTTYGDFSYKLAVGIRGTKTQISPNAVNTGTWNYVVVTWNGTTGYCYFNGDLMGTLNIGTAGLQTGYLLTVGGTANYLGAGANSLFVYEGDIAVANIYNRALSLSEVKQNYNHYKARFNLS